MYLKEAKHHAQLLNFLLVGKLFLKELKLNNFRCFSSLKLKFSNEINVITGKNGSGKTSILEAISILKSGNGIRNAQIVQIKKNQKLNFSSFGLFENGSESFVVGIGFKNEKKIAKLNLKTIKKTSILTKKVPIFYLTPKIEGLFLEGNTEKRQYFDEITNQFINQHEDYLNEHKLLRKNRLKLLQERVLDEIWLKNIEKELASLDIIIILNRLEVIKKLLIAKDSLLLKNIFTEYNISLEDDTFLEIEGMFSNLPALELETIFAKKYFDARNKDKESFRTSFGSHSNNFIIKQNSKLAEICSTGEQKTIMMGIAFASTVAYKNRFGTTPILILDEVFSHLDENNQKKLISLINEINPQTFLTSAQNLGLFNDFLHINLS